MRLGLQPYAGSPVFLLSAVFLALTLLLAGCETPLTPADRMESRRVLARLNDPMEAARATADAKAKIAGFRIENGRPPVALVETKPIYPLELRKRGVQGVVWVAFVVTPSGNVADARAVGDSDAPFVQPALRAVSQWKFLPATSNGVPVPCHIVVPIAFTFE